MRPDAEEQFEETETGILQFSFARPPVDKKAAVFLDRDGVINRRIIGGYVTDWTAFQFLPRAIEGLIALALLDAPIIVVSNQAGVGKGLLSIDTLATITNRFVKAVGGLGGRIDAVYYCPHAPAAGCACRKPRPGLLLQAERDWGLDLRASVLIGDSASDADAAHAAGSRSVLVAGDSDSGSEPLVGDSPSAVDLVEAAAITSRLREQLLDRA